MIHNFELAGRKIKLWQSEGETCGHVLMKALGYAMFVHTYPHLEIGRQVVLFKINYGAEQFAEQLRQAVAAKYRDNGRLMLVNFVSNISDLTATKQIAKVSADWFSETII